MKLKSGKKLICAAVIAVLLLTALICALRISALAGRLEAQKEAERWQGEDELEFRQLSVFLKESEAVTKSDVFSFRFAIQKAFKDAAIDLEGENDLFTDCYSVNDTLTISTEYGQSEATVTAVGGNFFAFHPLTLESGSYFTENDIMKNRVLIDRELSWALYGGVELTGMDVVINGEHFEIAGVYDHEDDRITKSAYSGGAAFYMPYDAYCALTEKEGISCYEIVLPDPVKNYAENLLKEKFPIGGGEYMVNSRRFEAKNLYKVYKDRFARTMKATTVSYPYWENAARVTEGRCAALFITALVCLSPIALAVLALIVLYAVKGKRALEDRILPRLWERVKETVRVRQRRHWEKRNNKTTAV